MIEAPFTVRMPQKKVPTASYDAALTPKDLEARKQESFESQAIALLWHESVLPRVVRNPESGEAIEMRPPQRTAEALQGIFNGWMRFLRDEISRSSPVPSFDREAQTRFWQSFRQVVSQALRRPLRDVFRSIGADGSVRLEDRVTLAVFALRALLANDPRWMGYLDDVFAQDRPLRDLEATWSDAEANSTIFVSINRCLGLTEFPLASVQADLEARGLIIDEGACFPETSEQGQRISYVGPRRTGASERLHHERVFEKTKESLRAVWRCRDGLRALMRTTGDLEDVQSWMIFVSVHARASLDKQARIDDLEKLLENPSKMEETAKMRIEASIEDLRAAREASIEQSRAYREAGRFLQGLLRTGYTPFKEKASLAEIVQSLERDISTGRWPPVVEEAVPYAS